MAITINNVAYPTVSLTGAFRDSLPTIVGDIEDSFDARFGGKSWRSIETLNPDEFGLGLPVSGSMSSIQDRIDDGTFLDLADAQERYKLDGRDNTKPLAAEDTLAYAAIQAALNEAERRAAGGVWQAGATVRLKSGLWYTNNSFEIGSFVGLVGMGPVGCTLRLNPQVSPRPVLMTRNGLDAMELCNWYSYLKARSTAGNVATAFVDERYDILNPGFHYPLTHAMCMVDGLTLDGGGSTVQDGRAAHPRDYDVSAGEAPTLLLIGSGLQVGTVWCHRNRGPGAYIRTGKLSVNARGLRLSEFANATEVGNGTLIADADGFPLGYPSDKKTVYIEKTDGNGTGTALPGAHFEPLAMPRETYVDTLDVTAARSFGAFLQLNDGILSHVHVNEVYAGAYVPNGSYVDALTEVQASYADDLNTPAVGYTRNWFVTSPMVGYMAAAHGINRTAVYDRLNNAHHYCWNEGTGVILGQTGMRFDKMHVYTTEGHPLWVTPNQQLYIGFFEPDGIQMPINGTPRQDGSPASIDYVTYKPRFGMFSEGRQGGGYIGQFFALHLFDKRLMRLGPDYTPFVSGADVQLEHALFCGESSTGFVISDLFLTRTPGPLLQATAKGLKIHIRGDTGASWNSYGDFRRSDAIQALLDANTGWTEEEAEQAYLRCLGMAGVYLHSGRGAAATLENLDLSMNLTDTPYCAVWTTRRGSIANCRFDIRGNFAGHLVFLDNNSDADIEHKFVSCIFEGSAHLPDGRDVVGAITANDASSLWSNLRGANHLGVLKLIRTPVGAYDTNNTDVVHIEGQLEKFTQDELSSISHPVNKIGKWAGRLVWDASNNRFVAASGPLNTDPWVDMNGNTVHTVV